MSTKSITLSSVRIKRQSEHLFFDFLNKEWTAYPPINARDCMIERGGSVVSSSRIGINNSRLSLRSSSVNVEENVSMNSFNEMLLVEDCFENSLRILEIFSKRDM